MAVKVRLLKDHNGSKKGTVGELAKGRADYLVREKIAEYVTDSKYKYSKPKSKTEAIEEPCKTC